MTENELTEILQESLLWEVLSDYIQSPKQAARIMQSAGYSENIASVSIQDTDCFFASVDKANDNEIYIDFEMPFIVLVNNYSIEAVAIGKMSIPSLSCFDYDKFDFGNMNKKELLKFKNIVTVMELNYFDVELIGKYE